MTNPWSFTNSRNAGRDGWKGDPSYAMRRAPWDNPGMIEFHIIHPGFETICVIVKDFGVWEIVTYCGMLKVGVVWPDIVR